MFHLTFIYSFVLQIDGNVLLSMPIAVGDDKCNKLEENNKKLTASNVEYQQKLDAKDKVQTANIV